MTLAVMVIVVEPPAHAEIAGPAVVVDGDMIKIHGRHIRLHGIDSPERRQTCIANGRQAVAVRAKGIPRPGRQDRPCIDPV